MEWRTGQPRKRLGTVEPCIPTRVSKPPVGPQWVHEIKRDGYRLIARKQGDRVRLFTRRGFDWTERYPRISAAVAALQPVRL
jgi:bifunctional non-homologous end joining protein LigD